MRKLSSPSNHYHVGKKSRRVFWTSKELLKPNSFLNMEKRSSNLSYIVLYQETVILRGRFDMFWIFLILTTTSNEIIDDFPGVWHQPSCLLVCALLWIMTSKINWNSIKTQSKDDIDNIEWYLKEKIAKYNINNQKLCLHWHYLYCITLKFKIYLLWLFIRKAVYMQGIRTGSWCTVYIARN